MKFFWNGSHHAYRANYSTTTALGQLTDILYEAADENTISVAMSIDESADFNCLNHDVLLEKLALYKRHSTTITLIKSYLSYRSQFVDINGHPSNMNKIKSGVPQGSTIGPTLFNLYVNELPDVVNDFNTCQEEAHLPGENLFNSGCKKCGILPCYADDAVYTVASNSRNWNQERIEIILNRLTNFLNSNHLTVNKTKTVIQELMLKKNRCKIQGTPPKLITLTDQSKTLRKSKQHTAIYYLVAQSKMIYSGRPTWRQEKNPCCQI